MWSVIVVFYYLLLWTNLDVISSSKKKKEWGTWTFEIMHNKMKKSQKRIWELSISTQLPPSTSFSFRKIKMFVSVIYWTNRRPRVHDFSAKWKKLCHIILTNRQRKNALIFDRKGREAASSYRVQSPIVENEKSGKCYVKLYLLAFVKCETHVMKKKPKQFIGRYIGISMQIAVQYLIWRTVNWFCFAFFYERFYLWLFLFVFSF